MRVFRLALLFLSGALALGGAQTARAQEDEALTAARLRGVKFLKSRQKSDGSWQFTSHEVGITALCTVALIENGVETTESEVQNGYEYVKKRARDLKNTYDISLAIVLLQRMGDRRDKPLIKNLAARLMAGQMDSGGWHYTCPGAELDVEKVLRDPSNGPRPKEGYGDNSCTQFAVLGLWVASRVGVDIEKTLKKVTGRFEKHQTDDGGWSYALDPKGGKPASSPSMTGAGLFCLAVARAWELREAQKEAQKGGKSAAAAGETPPRKTLLDDAVFAKGLTRTGQFASGIGPGAGRYFLWSVERVGVLLGLEKVGATDWFQIGSAALLKDQKEDGSWPTAWADTDKDGLSDTCFAILFLRKANLGSDISRLLEGEHEEKFEIVGRQPAVRFHKLADAVAAAQAGETVRINGNGPWRLGHLVLDKNLTLQAGHGFAPAFKFEVGRNKKGTRFKPETEAEGRDMIAVLDARITLEGLKLQMEPPKLDRQVPWSTITVNGGELRLLNCSLSEISQQGTAAIAWRSPGALIVRNSQLMGGKSTIDISGGGDQELVFDNSLAFSQTGMTLTAPAEAAASAHFRLRCRHSVVQAKEVLTCGKYSGTIEVEADSSAFRSDWLSSTFLRGLKDKTGRDWKGGLNVYDVKNWIGSEGKTVEIKDMRDWAKFWGNDEKDSFKRTAPFVGLRQVGNFSHEANVQDWQLEFPSSAEGALQRNRVGINTYLAGPGVGYDQYRETIGYSTWKRNRLDLSKAE